MNNDSAYVSLQGIATVKPVLDTLQAISSSWLCVETISLLDILQWEKSVSLYLDLVLQKNKKKKQKTNKKTKRTK